jgi:hypothetical protein
MTREVNCPGPTLLTARAFLTNIQGLHGVFPLEKKSAWIDALKKK